MGYGLEKLSYFYPNNSTNNDPHPAIYQQLNSQTKTSPTQTPLVIALTFPDSTRVQRDNPSPLFIAAISIASILRREQQRQP